MSEGSNHWLANNTLSCIRANIIKQHRPRGEHLNVSSNIFTLVSRQYSIVSRQYSIVFSSFSTVLAHYLSVLNDKLDWGSNLNTSLTASA